MDFKVLFIYLMIGLIPFMIVHAINGLINKEYYSGIGFKATGNVARFFAITSLVTIPLILINLLVFADVFKKVNLYMAAAVFIVPFIFSKAYLGYLERTYQHYRKPKNTKVNWIRALFISFGIFFLLIAGFIALAYLTFTPK